MYSIGKLFAKRDAEKEDGKARLEFLNAARELMWALHDKEGNLNGEAISFAMDIIGRDLSAGAASDFALRKKQFDGKYYVPWFTSRGERVTMNTAGINVISPPKDAWKLRKAGISVSQAGFRSEMRSEADQAEGNYFEELSLLVITKGYHHAAAAVTLGVDFNVLATVCEIGELFEVVKTDGAEWSKEGEEKRYPVLDVRVALLFWLAQKRYLIQKGKQVSFPN